MSHSLCCLLLALVAQAPPEPPVTLDGTSLPTRVLESPQEHGGLSLYVFSPDGALLAGASGVGTMTFEEETSTFGGEVLLWDPVTGKSIRTFGAHASTPTTLQFSADGTRLLSYSREDHAARLWSVSDGRLLADLSLGGPGSRKQPPMMSPDGRILIHLAERPLAAGSQAEVAYLLEAWHLEEDRCLWTRTVEDPTESLDVRFAISPDGRTVALSRLGMKWQADGDVFRGERLECAHELLAIESGEPIWSIPIEKRERDRRHPEKQVLFTPDGSGILMVDSDTMDHYAATNGQRVGEPIDLEDDDSVDAVHFSADGRYFMVTRFFDRQLDVHAFPGGAEVFRASFAFPDNIRAPGPSPDLHRVAGRVGFSDPLVIDLSSGLRGNGNDEDSVN